MSLLEQLMVWSYNENPDLKESVIIINNSFLDQYILDKHVKVQQSLKIRLEDKLPSIQYTPTYRRCSLVFLTTLKYKDMK